MQPLQLDGKLHHAIAIDLCFTCQGLWFDAYESTRIAPDGIIRLFRLIHDRRDEPRQPLAARLGCPRCDAALQHVHDVGRNGRFNYQRCPQEHGRFTPFAQLMIEKGFVRQLTPAEIRVVAARIAVIHCNGCGAPFDIRKDAACPHCRAPIAILDPAAVEKALAHYRHASLKHEQRDPPAPTDAAEALLATEKLTLRRAAATQRKDVNNAGDLLVAGIEALWSLFES